MDWTIYTKVNPNTNCVTSQGVFDLIKKHKVAPRQTLYAHPDHQTLLKKMDVGQGAQYCVPSIPIVFDKNIPKFAKKWQFPHDPFIEWEKVDEEWAVPVKYGCWVDDETQPVVFAMNDGILSPAKTLQVEYPKQERYGRHMDFRFSVLDNRKFISMRNF